MTHSRLPEKGEEGYGLSQFLIEQDAAAKLISAAPALLEALKKYQFLLPALKDTSLALATLLAENYAYSEKAINLAEGV